MMREKNKNWIRSPEQHRKYRKIDKAILSELSDALILFKMKTWNKGDFDIHPLRIDNTREIVGNNSDKKRGPVDVLWNIATINICETQKNIQELLSAEKVSEEDQAKFERAVKHFIHNSFIIPRNKLERKKNCPHANFRRHYSEISAQKGKTEQEKKLYRDIYLTLANILYEKKKFFLDTNWEVNEAGLTYIGEIFQKTIKNIPSLGSSKSFYKIFHDWDFNFLRNETQNGGVKRGLLEHYVEVIKYLMEINGFNAYAEGWEDWATERYRSKKSFLNALFSSSKLEVHEQREIVSDRKNTHQLFANLREVSVDEAIKNDKKAPFRVASNRLKSENSTLQKIWGKTTAIKDESGLRLTAYGESSCEENEETIQKVIEIFFEKLKHHPWIEILGIELDRKWNFISQKWETQILNDIKETTGSNAVSLREKAKGNSEEKLSSISTKYQNLTKEKPSPWLKRAYEIANGEIKRGSNGNYQDFKLIIEYRIDEKEFNKTSWQDKIKKDNHIFQEISFYPNSNDLNMGNHHILDLEKKIFWRIRNMNDKELWKSISLNRLRYFTETAIKDISFDLDMFEEKIRKKELPAQENDNYSYLEAWGERVSLRNLIYRNKDNDERFDALICMILNYFIKNNKISYINKEGANYYGLITPKMLKDPQIFKSRRFLSSDILRNTASNQRNSKDFVCFYSDHKGRHVSKNFYEVSLGDLWDFIGLENNNKE